LDLARRVRLWIGLRVVLNHHPSLDRLAAANVGRQRDFLHGYFGLRIEHDRHDINADPRVGERAGNRASVTEIFVAIGFYDDPLEYHPSHTGASLRASASECSPIGPEDRSPSRDR